MKAIALVSLLALGGCADLNRSLTEKAAGDTAIRLCESGKAYYATLKAPSRLQQGAKTAMDYACADPEATADFILSIYYVIKANRQG
tara:strand:- start:402 stop:662 length:261 start_codon:yes stop_codon:yes gene_type:complete